LGLSRRVSGAGRQAGPSKTWVEPAIAPCGEGAGGRRTGWFRFICASQKPIYTYSPALCTGVAAEGRVEMTERTSSMGAKMDTEAPSSNGAAEGCCRILVAEDIVPNQLLIRLLLEKEGFEVTIAGNGDEAVRWGISQVFDVILMDIQMPRMDGYMATAALREKGVEAPIIAVTANTTQDDRKRCFAAGCDDYLPKPIDFKKLVAALKKWSGRAKNDPLEQGKRAVVVDR